ncbi:MAG TPA: hypothetical protein VKU41_17195 [Polyangiaceae bacterium]|nr:hypothetical protein [Polyangiaceae bacterium]
MNASFLKSSFLASSFLVAVGLAPQACDSGAAGPYAGPGTHGDGSSGGSPSTSGASSESGVDGSADGGDGGSCPAPSDSCCCQEDIVTTPTCDAHGSLRCGAGFTLHQGSVCACSTPGVCCTPGPDAGDAGDGGPSCPSSPPQGQPCSVDGATCHYPSGQGATDCGCTGGSWQCVSGCSPSTTPLHVDPSRCEPQLRTTTSCNPFSAVCSFTVEVPCWGDAGKPLGDLDAGLNQCTAWCAAVAPPDSGSSASPCIALNFADGGSDGGAVLVGTCGGCGI